MIRRPTCSALLIGNELLNGKTRDSNAKMCSSTGFRLCQINVIPDETPKIVNHIRTLSKETDYVFTSGGIGPTHDDITYESIAAAFNVPLEYHQATLRRMEYFYRSQNTPFTASRKRMALIPRGSKVFFASKPHDENLAKDEAKDDSILKPMIPFPSNQPGQSRPKTAVWTPVVSIENIIILPGIPSLYSFLCNAYFNLYLVPRLKSTGESQIPLYKVVCETTIMEGDLAEHLSFVQSNYNGKVSIGSYPRWSLDDKGENDGSARVMITFEGDDAREVDKCVALVKEKIPLIEIKYL